MQNSIQEFQRARRSWWTVLVVAGVAYSSANAADTADPPAVRTAMDEIYQAMQFLLPRAATDEGLAKPADRDAVRRALGRVADAARHVEAHVEDSTAEFLADSLADDFEQAQRAFTHGNASSAAFFVREAVDDCVSCHTRLEAPHDAPLSKDFAEQVAFSEFLPRGRLRLAIATRQFDEALEIAEQALADPSTPVDELDALVTDYLITAVRVTRDLDRIGPTLRALEARSDIWEQFRNDLAVWRDTIDGARRHPPVVSLSAARALIDEGRRLTRVPIDRTGRVHGLLASRILFDWLAAHGDAAPRAADAYYELGLSELAIGRDYWHSKSDFHLERAIRLAPHTEIARSAFARLEQEVVLGFTGSSGTHIPEDERARLDAMRQLAGPESE